MNPSQPSQASAVIDARSHLRRHAGVLATCSVAVTLLLLTPTLYMLQVYDRVLSTRNLDTLALLSLLALGLYALLAALEQVRGALLVRLSVQVDQSLAGAVFDAVHERLGRDPASAHRLGGDLHTVRQFIGGALPPQLMDAPLTAVFVAAAFLVDPWLGATVALSAVLLAVLAWVNERRSRDVLRESQGLAQSASLQMAEALRHGEAIRAMGMRQALAQRWQRANRAALDAHLSASQTSALVTSLLRFVRLACQSAALGVGAWLVLQGRMSPGAMMAGTILLGRALAPVEALVGGWRQMAAARDAWARLTEALAMPARPEVIELPAAQGALAVEQVSWRAEGAPRAVLGGVSFQLAAGQSLAIVGGSGAGKSTLARLLAGALEPATGAVRLDGATFAQHGDASRAQAVGYLPQEVQLFDATVAENIARLGEVDDAAVVQAAQRAGIHELILRLPQGYHTRIVPGVLSGGQRQRLGLARALYGRPRLLVLDEPNAHLDEAGEAALRAALEAHRADAGTAVVVTHRTALLQRMDRLLVLDDGRMTAFGTPAELMARPAKAGPVLARSA